MNTDHQSPMNRWNKNIKKNHHSQSGMKREKSVLSFAIEAYINPPRTSPIKVIVFTMWSYLNCHHDTFEDMTTAQMGEITTITLGTLELSAKFSKPFFLADGSKSVARTSIMNIGTFTLRSGFALSNEDEVHVALWNNEKKTKFSHEKKEIFKKKEI